MEAQRIFPVPGHAQQPIVIGVDVQGEMAEIADARQRVVREGATQLSFGGGPFTHGRTVSPDEKGVRPRSVDELLRSASLCRFRRLIKYLDFP